MLKKISKILMISLISIMLVGCGSSNITETDLKSVSSTIEKSLKNMEVVDDSTLEDVYDLDLSLMKEHIVKQNDDGDLYALIKTDDTVKVKEQMKDYFGKVKEFNTAYSKSQCILISNSDTKRLEILENREEKEIGDTLIYIVAEDASDIYQDILENIK